MHCIRCCVSVGSLCLVLLLGGCVSSTTSRFDQQVDDSEAGQAYINIAYQHIQRGNMLPAKQALNSALELQPKSAGAHLGLAAVYEREREAALAEKHYKLAIQYSEKDSDARFALAKFLFNQRRYADVYQQLHILEQDTLYLRRGEVFDFWGVVALSQGDTQQAIARFEKAVLLNRLIASSYLALASLYFNQQQFPKGYKNYQEFQSLVRLQVTQQSDSSLLLGIQLAYEMHDFDQVSSLALLLRSKFPRSQGAKKYQLWQASHPLAPA